jgi:hypothetical protein
MRVSEARSEDNGSKEVASKLIVRGDCSSDQHMDILEKARREVEGLGGGSDAELIVEPCGGGRIEHDPTGEIKVRIFGYSVAFGPAVHEVAAVLVQRAHPMYKGSEISIAYEGY